MQSGKSFTTEEIKAIGAIPMNFVLGKERSGTTLLQLMLNTHANIVAPPESRFIILLYFRYGKTQKWTEEIIVNFCNDLFTEGLFKHFWGVDKNELLSVLVASKDMLSFSLICKIIFRLSSPGKQDVHIFFDKNPLYYYFLPELKNLFPEAKYIHLVRDYRANLVSHRRVFTVKKGTDIAYRWMKVNMLIEAAKRLSPGKYFTLTYESLVSNPEQKMKEVCSFLNLPYDKNMVQNHQSGMYSNFNRNKNEGFLKVHQNVFNPINSKHITEWEETLSAEELANVEAVAGEYGETKYGYKMKTLRNSKPAGFLLMDLKYTAIKALYRKALSNPWLYWSIKKYVWRSF
jgi:hypothetical protein